MSLPEARSAVDNRPRRADDRRMEDRFSTLEQNVSIMTAELAVMKLNCATRQDLAALRSDMTAEFGKVRLETAAEFGKVHVELEKVRTAMAALENRLFQRLIMWITSIMLTVVGGVVGAVYYIARYVH